MDGFDLSRMFKRVDESHKKMDAEMKRLLSGAPMEMPKVGDIVVVAIGLINRGHLWIRSEAKVIAIGDNSIKIECDQYNTGKPWQEWVHSALITDILKKNQGEGKKDR